MSSNAFTYYTDGLINFLDASSRVLHKGYIIEKMSASMRYICR